MKKVKLLALLASSVMILAGCGNGSGSTSTEPEPTSTSSSSEPTPEWSEADAKAIKDFVHTNLPAFNDLKLETIEEDATYIRMMGKAGTDATVEAYGAALEGYKFEAAGFVPEDIDEDYDADTVVYYSKSLSSKTSEMAYVTVGLEDGTNKLLVCATYGSAFFDDFFVGKSRVSIWTLTVTLEKFHEYVGDYLLWANGSVGYTDESLSEDDADARIEEEMHYFSYPTVAACVDPEDGSATGILVADYQFGYPFTLGNAYSEQFHSILQIGYYEATADEEAAYQAQLVADNYVVDKTKYIDDDKTILESYYKNVVDGYGTYYADEFFYPGFLSSGSASHDVLVVSYDYDAPAAA